MKHVLSSHVCKNNTYFRKGVFKTKKNWPPCMKKLATLVIK